VLDEIVDSLTACRIISGAENQKNDAPPHLKRWGLNRRSFFGCSKNHPTLKGGVFVKFLDIRKCLSPSQRKEN